MMDRTEPHWYIRTADGIVYGPVGRAQLRVWRTEGRLQADSEVSSEFPYQWKKANLAFPEFFDVSSSSLAQSSNSQAVWPHRGPWLVVLAIMGFLCGCPVFSISAWVMSSAELRDMEAGRRDPAGRNLAILAWRLGVVAATIWIIIAMIAFFIAIQRAAQSM